MGTDLSSLVERTRLQEIVDIHLDAIPLQCPPIENRIWPSRRGHRVVATGVVIEAEALERALDPEVIVKQKVSELVEEFQEQVSAVSNGCKRTLVETLQKPIIGVTPQGPPTIWVMNIAWEVEFEAASAKHVLPVDWIDPKVGG
ncbi:MAG: hypothetical protein F4X11_26275 [Acidobacteria bacterium]|nr:hypothetical protein [Acidobacteriota bacterium]